MPTEKVAITLDRELLKTVDWLVAQGRYSSRSQAIQTAVRENLAQWKRTRLSEVLEKVNPCEERKLADERMKGEAC